MAWEREDMLSACGITPFTEQETAMGDGGEKWVYLGLGFAGLLILISLWGYPDLAVKLWETSELAVGGLVLLFFVVGVPVMWLRGGISWFKKRNNANRKDR